VASNTTRWGLLSTARINSRLIAAARRSEQAEVVAVASRDRAKAEAFARANGIERAHGSYDDLLSDDAVDAVYVSLPNHLHVEWARRALEAGKHVLCEKPLTSSGTEAVALFELAERSERLLMEAFMWRHNPQTRALECLLDSGVVGRVSEIRTGLGFDLEGDWKAANGDGDGWREDARLDPELDGGALMDVGVYCLSAIRLLAGEPIGVTASQQLGPTGVDLRTSGVVECVDGVVAHFDCFMDAPRREWLEIVGDAGTIRVPTPFLCGQPGIEVSTGDGTRTVDVPPADSYQLELEDISAAIVTGTRPLLGASDAVAQAAAVELVRQAIHEGSRDA
jgi:xylose dehydrogenase (NAD/NADP)